MYMYVYILLAGRNPVPGVLSIRLVGRPISVRETSPH